MTTYAVRNTWHGTDEPLPAAAWCGTPIPAGAERWTYQARHRDNCPGCAEHDRANARVLADEMASGMRAVAAPCGHLLGTIPDGPLGDRVRIDLLRKGPVGSKVVTPSGEQVFGLLVENTKCGICTGGSETA